MQSEKGFSLIEMMITLAISAIIIGAAFGSYTIISRNFEWQKDMKYISQSARNVIEMIQKDIRNAGFRFEANAAITDPVKIYDAGDCCDRIEIIYDETINKRVKIDNLQVLKILLDKNMIVVKGAVPGPKNSYITIEK